MNDTNIERFLIGGVVLTFVAALAWYSMTSQRPSTDDSVQIPNQVATVTPLIQDAGVTDVLGDEPTALPQATATLTDDEVAIINEQIDEDIVEATPTPGTADSLPTDVVVSTENLDVARISWQACDDKEVKESGFECGIVPVPLDYMNPNGPKIDIAVIRYPARGERIGAILYNPGGPGGSGFDYVAWLGIDYVSNLGLDGFDFVGFDPRGVDRSNGLKCMSDADIDRYMFGDPSPDTPEEEAFFDEAEKAFIDGCKNKFGDTLQFYSTSNTARDMDVIRAAIGDEQISYLGVSYGTYLGAVYAKLFPSRVRAMVLDAAYAPNGDSIEEQYTTQEVGFEKALNNWIAWCEKNESCAFHSDDVGARWDALYEQYNQNPVTTDDGRITYQSVIMHATMMALYSEKYWEYLADALAKAEQGNVKKVWELVDERDENGAYSEGFHAMDVILCASGIDHDIVPNPDALLTNLRNLAPRMTVDYTIADLTSGGICNQMMPPQPMAEIGYFGDAPILVIGGENDPATPLRWSYEMRDVMGPNVALLISGNEGHAQVLNSDCVDRAASEALISLLLPEGDITCDANNVVNEPINEVPPNQNPPEPQPTAIPEPTATPTATPVPVELIRGEVRWSGEKRVVYDVVVETGATLIIEPNTTVFMAPGTSFYIDGNVRALGSAAAPVRITSDGQAWGGMFVRNGGDVMLLGAVISRGGGTTTLIAAERASVVMRDTQINNNLGHIQLRDSAFTFENSTMRDNQLPYGAAIDATFSYNSAFRVVNSRVGPNTQADGAPAVAVKSTGSATQLTLEVSGSLLTNQSGPNLQLESAADLSGSIQCNAFVAGDVGVSIRTNTTQLPAISLFVRNNAFEQHRGVRTNQYEPHQGNTWRTLYGMTSNVAVNGQGNWWDHAKGPYDPKRYTTGRGELAGVNVDAGNWLTTRPVCAPQS